jgi:putative tryptophan/tyrosine transport system substrate-binding protein
MVISIVLILAICLLGGADQAAAQQIKIYRIGYLDPGPRSVNDANLAALQKGLTELGWVEGKNITFEYRFADGKGPAYDVELARELVRLNVDLIFAASASAQRAREATTKIIPFLWRQESFKASPGPAVMSLGSPTLRLSYRRRG